MLVDPMTNTVAASGSQNGFVLSLDDVQAYPSELD